jgi:stage II sporulation protein D
LTSLLFVGAALLAVLTTAPSSAQGGARALVIRVLLSQRSRATLVVATPHTAAYADGSVFTQSDAPLEWRLSVTPTGKVGVQTAQGVFDTGRQSLTLQTGKDGYFQFNGSVYRDSASVVVQGGSLLVLNLLDLEDYVRGVLPKEMPTNWPDEALKAQAVIARTYAVSRLSPNAPYDLCASEKCQVYDGASAETPRGNAASEATRGEILSWQGRAAQTYFHADSGGFTASSREIWGGDVPYLRALPDPGSRTSETPWSVTVSRATIQAAVNRFAPRAGAFKSLSIPARTASGRPDAILINGTERITGSSIYAFSRAIGARSSMIGVQSLEPLVIVGYGNGHGVGLSQFGARWFASQGYSYRQILGYYYAGVNIGQYEVAP